MKIEIRDKRLNALFDVDTPLEKLATGFCFIEGPVWHPTDKYLVFSDIICNTMYRWSADDGVSVYRRPSYMANGNTFDRQGRLLTCEHGTSRVSRQNLDGVVEVIAAHYQGKELNSPNDIIVKSDGGVYFTDPNSGRSQGFGIPREQELPFQGVYRLELDGVLRLLVDDFSKPNGLCFTPDEKQLLINDTDRQHIRVFDVQPDGALTNGRLWAKLEHDGIGVADGMKFDSAGNLYCTGPGGIHVFDPKVNCLGVILMPEQAANLAWGDDDLRSLYITASTTLYRIRVG